MDKELKNLVIAWLTRKENRVFQLAGDGVTCKKCSTRLKIVDRRGSTRLSEHLRTQKHQKASQSSLSQTGIAASIKAANAEDVDPFNYELFLLFTASNIPLHNLSSARFKEFFLRHSKQHVLWSTSPGRYIAAGSRRIQEEIASQLDGQPFAIYIDETQDCRKRKVVNTIVLPLTGKPENPMLYDTSFVDSADTSTLSGIVNRIAMSISKDPKLFRLLVTDQCRTNLAAGRELRAFFKNFFHITCLAHGLHLLCETIREEYPKVNSLVSNMKSVLSYSKKRQDLYRLILEAEPMPPTPVITRWGTFLNTAIHHQRNFEKIKIFVSKIEAKGSDSTTLKALVKDPQLQTQLDSIAQFALVPRAITELESRSKSMEEQLTIHRSVRSALSGRFARRLDEVLGRNPDFEKLSKIPDTDSNLYRYAVLSNAEVERSFSLYKNLLSDRRHSLSEENIKRHLSIQFNSELLFKA
jgi:DNA-binding CsgD family transcriptional regulator